MRSRMMAVGVICVVLASCATLPTSQEANEAVLMLQKHGSWAWALAIALIWADVVLPILVRAVTGTAAAEVVHDHAGTACCECQRVSAAQAAAGASDHDHFAFESQFHVLHPFVSRNRLRSAPAAAVQWVQRA
jgi:hypothetical protein